MRKDILKRIEQLERITHPVKDVPYVSITMEDWDLLNNPEVPERAKEQILHDYGLLGNQPTKVFVGISPDDWDK